MTAGQACDLCGTPAPWGGHARSFDGVPRTFCCMGCLNVYAILVESGQVTGDFRDTELYRRSLEMGLIAAPEAAPPALPADAEVREELFQVSGMLVRLLRLADRVRPVP